MKKVIKQLGQLIFKHRKKLIYGVFAFIVSQICFFNLGGIGSEVYAADGNTTSQSDVFQEKATEWYEKISFLQKVIYVVLYPLLVVAGKLVDNSLVYGEVFGFDAVLWKLWNIVKNLANFTLGFLVVYKIFKFLIAGQKPGEVKKILISGLIAGVGIQASWFIMAALIDVSTIVTYGVGGLPINILKENSQGIDDETLKHNPYVYKNIVYLDINDIDSFSTYLTNQSGDHHGDFHISECRRFSYVYDNGARSEELLLAPKMIYYADENGKIYPTLETACHVFGQVYDFNGLYDKIHRRTCSDLDNCKSEQIDYNQDLQEAESEIKGNKVDKSKVESLIENAKLLEIGDAHSTGGIVGGLNIHYAENFQYGLDIYNKRHGEGKTNRLQDVLDGNSYVGVFTVLYSSLISSVGVIPSDAGIFAALLNAALSFGHMIAIGIPLIAVAIVFMMRIGIIWVAVAMAPFIVLLTAFGIKDAFKGKFLECFEAKNLIIIIFSPAIICFAISVSTILVIIINNLNVDGVITKPTEILGGLIRINIGGLTVPIGKLIVAVFGIAITWFLVWAAVEASKLGQSSIIQSLKGLATSTLGSMPIIPVVGKDADGNLKTTMVGASTAFGGGGLLSKMMNEQIREYNNADNEVIQNFINPDQAKQKKDNYYKDQIVKSNLTTDDWTKEIIKIKSEEGGKSEDYTFDNVANNRKKDIIEAINALEESKRVAFGKKGEIKFNDGENDVVYTFNTTTKKYEVKTPSN